MATLAAVGGRSLSEILVGLGEAVIGTDARLRSATALAASTTSDYCPLYMLRDVRLAVRADGELRDGGFVFHTDPIADPLRAATLEIELALDAAEADENTAWRPLLYYRPPAFVVSEGGTDALRLDLGDGELLEARFDAAGRLLAETAELLQGGPVAMRLLARLAEAPATRTADRRMLQAGADAGDGGLRLVGDILAAGERLQGQLGRYRPVSLLQPERYRLRLLGGRLRAWTGAGGGAAARREDAPRQRLVVDLSPAGAAREICLDVEHARFIADTDLRRRVLEALVAHFRAAREARRNRHGERPLEEFVERLFPSVYDPLGAPPECRPDSGFGPPRGAAAFSAAALCELAALLADETSVGRALVARLDDDETLLHLPPVAGDERWLLLIMRLQAPRRGVFEVDSASLLDGCFVRADPHPARARWRRSVQPFLVRALESLQRWQQASP